MTELKNRLQFVITLALFFPIILDAVYKASLDELESSFSTLKWGAVIAVLILSYLLIELEKGKMPDFVIKSTNRLLVAEVAMFIPVLYVLASTHQGLISGLQIVLFTVGVYGLIFIPMGILILLAVSIVWEEIKEARKK